MPRLRPVSFDFDDTLVRQPSGTPIHEAERRLRAWAATGYPIVIVTARPLRLDNVHSGQVNLVFPRSTDGQYDPIAQHCRRRKLPIQQIYYTNLGLKGPLLREIGACLHVDDNDEQLESAHAHGVPTLRAELTWK